MSARVSDWLHELGLGQYADRFDTNDIDWELLADLDQQTLKDIGIESAGHRLRILKAIEKLDPPSVMPADSGAGDSEDAATAWQRRPGERKPVTMLFTDVVGSTALTERLDAEEAHDLLYRATQCMCRAVENNRGTVCRFMGDGIMAMFGAPQASERHAIDACRAALEMQAGIADYARQLDSGAGASVQIRVGLHSGEVVVLEVGDDPDRPEYDASGPTVPLAARMEQSADPGTILMTAATRSLAGTAIETLDHAPVAVKGFSDPVPVFRLDKLLTAAESARAATSLPMIGRRSEMAQFRGLLATCLEDGRGQCLHIRGEAGIGKSRLAAEMMRLAESQGFAGHKALVLDFGASRGQGAIPSLLRSLLEIDEDTDAEKQAGSVAQAIADRKLDGDNRVFINDLLDLQQPLELKTLYDAMNVEARGEGKRAALADILARLSQRHPRLLLIEDLHWADAETLGYLARIAASAAAGPMLMVFTSRVDDDPIDRKWRAGTGDIPIITWDLSPLRREESLQLVSAFSDAETSFIERCIERADGNPLFLEQLLLSHRSARNGEVPDSIKSLLLARLDQLPAADKRALQAAAVLGKRFDFECLRFLIADPDYDRSGLIERQLIRPEGSFYLFAHALIQEGAYASQLKAQRASLHKRAAEWYRSRDADLHAVHLDQAKDSGAAAAYLAAGREHLASYRPERALELARRGAEIAPAEELYELKSLQGELLRVTGATNDSIAVFREAIESAANDGERCRALVGLAEGLAIVESQDELLQVLGDAEAIADPQGFWSELAIVEQLRGGIYFFRGQHEQCQSACNLSLEYARKAGSPEVVARALSGLADAMYCRGRFLSANRFYTECIEFAREHGLGRIIAANLSMRGYSFRYQNDLESAQRDYDEAIDLAARTHHLRAESVACYAGLHIAENGDRERGEALLRRGLEVSEIVGSGLLQGAALAALGKLLARDGDRQTALEMARRAIQILRNSASGMTFRGPSALGVVALATDDADERQAALDEGKNLLLTGSMAHSHFNFCEDGIESCLRTGAWDEVEWFIDHLQEYTREEPLPLSEFLVARARALTMFGRGERGAALTATLQSLAAEASSAGLRFQLPAIEAALSAK